MDKLIGPNEASILKNMQASDNAIVIKEIITHFKKMEGQKANLILEVDLEKAGIRQGDPFSSYLFILCLEVLSRKIEKEVKLKHWTPIKTSTNGPNISHLFFADDLTRKTVKPSKAYWTPSVTPMATR
uniref:Reverse transcriptase domain-containing protein n=1 Tax=Solanum lycopersicum TaxID=4081 RepID=A0A3Q7GTK3_SOLLC